MNEQWLEGKEAYNDGDERDDNPYRSGTEEHHHWDQGWESAWNDDV